MPFLLSRIKINAKGNTTLSSSIPVPTLARLPGTWAPGKSKNRPKCFYFLLAGLVLVVCLWAIPYSIPVQFIGLIAFIAMALSHFAVMMCYQRSDRRLEAIFQASPNPIVVYNKQGHPENLNPAFIQVFGWTLDELAGKRIPFVPETEKSITGRKIQEIFQTSRPVTFETRRMTKTGDILDVIISAAIAMSPDKTPSEMVVSITDITERKQVEAQLRQAQKMEAIGTLAGGIAHDFNNLLSPLIGYSEMLQEDLPDDSPMQDNVDEILAAGLRGKELVNQILSLGRRSDDKPKAIELPPIVREALKLIRASIPSNIRIHQEIDSDCGPVMGNPIHIHQVVMNLATNAYQAMEETGGHLSVTLKQVFMREDKARLEGLPQGNYALLTVADTGIGIDQEIMAKIFDPYFSTKEIDKGTGFGLSVVRGIISNVGGNIRVLSEPGRGTEFRIYWPLTRLKREMERKIPQTPIPGGSEKILLVDDEKTVMKMVSQTLGRLGYRVAAYTSGIEALAAFKADPEGFDLVLSDMTMPEMTGDILAREVMALRPSIPVLISTGNSSMLTPELVREVGIKGVVMKPASKSTFATAVRQALDNSGPPNEGYGALIR